MKISETLLTKDGAFFLRHNFRFIGGITFPQINQLVLDNLHIVLTISQVLPDTPSFLRTLSHHPIRSTRAEGNKIKIYIINNKRKYLNFFPVFGHSNARSEAPFVACRTAAGLGQKVLNPVLRVDEERTKKQKTKNSRAPL